MSCGRFRHFGIIFYATPLELDKILIKYAERISHYAFIKHDKDVYENELKDEDGNVLHAVGDLKKEHYHILVDFYNACSINACKRIFKTENDNAKVEVINDVVSSYRYLTHEDNPEKAQYSKDMIVSDNINYYEHLCIIGAKKDSDNMAMDIINDILANVNPRILVHRYGRDFVIHMNQYYDCAREIKDWENLHKVKDISEYYEDEQLPFE